jgi:lactoylglutathione lyase
MITGCDHIGIQVRDIERSIAFYRDCLGFRQVGRWSMAQEYVQRVVGRYPDVTLDIALLEIPGTRVFLEILEYKGAQGAPIDPDTANPGTGHFCLFCENIDALYAELSAKGVSFVSEPQTPTAGPNKGGRLVYMMDPDGIRVELVQTRLRSDGSPRTHAETRHDA